MGRTLRIHLPGAAFHITARTQNQLPWFIEEMRTSIEDIIVKGVASSDGSLIAQTVMPNHFHIVLKQGMRPLGWIMQPIMRRVALLAQRTLGLKNHIFGATFWAGHLDTAEYLRTTIIYTHFNPERAGLCTLNEAYLWTSHKHFSAGTSYDGCHLQDVLQLFADKETRSIAELVAQYMRHVEWRREKDRCDVAGEPFVDPQPLARWGDQVFAQRYVAWPNPPRPVLIDLRDAAVDVLRQIDPTLEIHAIQGPGRDRYDVRIRRQVIAALRQRGYPPRAIARYLRVSDSVVSDVGMRIRYGTLI